MAQLPLPASATRGIMRGMDGTNQKVEWKASTPQDARNGEYESLQTIDGREVISTYHGHESCDDRIEVCSQEWAMHIEKAVNLHHELVNVAKAALARIESDIESPAFLCSEGDMLRSVIRLAEANALPTAPPVPCSQASH